MQEQSQLSPEDITLYARQISLPEIGVSGQQKLKSARILCVGAGGLGSPALLYLAGAGIGTIGIVDDDNIEPSNLHRQVLYTTADVGRKKIQVAKERLSALNPAVNFILHEEHLQKNNALSIIANYDLVIDGSDNFATRYLVNDACFHLKKPNIYASILQFAGQCSIFCAPQGPCYRCLYESPPPPKLIPSCADSGVLGVLPGLLGTIQATEAIKLILGIGKPLVGRLLTIDALTMQFRELHIRQNPNCLLCAHQQSFDTLPNYETNQCVLSNIAEDEITPQQLRTLQLQKTDFLLLDVREPYEHHTFNLGGLLVPLAQLPSQLNKLDPKRLTVVYCRVGARSAYAVKLLQKHGFTNVKNLIGGVLAWQAEF